MESPDRPRLLTISPEGLQVLHSQHCMLESLNAAKLKQRNGKRDNLFMPYPESFLWACKDDVGGVVGSIWSIY